MRRLLAILLLALIPLRTLAQQEGSGAVIVYDDARFTMTSLSDGTLTRTVSIIVFNSSGNKAAVFMEHTSPSIVLTSFSGELLVPGAKTQKLKKKDLTSVSESSGLIDDGYIMGYSPSPGRYPYTVSYTYTIQYKRGFAVFPAYIPVTQPNVALQGGKYTIVVPHGTAIRQYCTPAAGDAVFSEDGRNDVYTWTITSYGGFSSEHNMPSVMELIPIVRASPEEFMFEGVAGRQNSWESLGLWQAHLLEGTDDLSQATVASVREMTAGASTTLEKVRILYNYLREKTRYVSIQLGIGGFKPFPASSVDRQGFGDCKALSNYMRSLLDAAGVESMYVILHTDRRDFYPSYPSFGQTNHAMLAVPLPEMSDTLWLECTSPIVPLGYRHEDVAGHEVVLIHPDGGEKVRVRSYADSLSLEMLELDVSLSPDGKAAVQACYTTRLRDVEPWMNYRDYSPEAWRRFLTEKGDVQPQDFTVINACDNFDTYDGPSWVPEFRVTYGFNVRSFSRSTVGRLMVPVNPFSKALYAQRGERKNPLVMRESSHICDIMHFHVPEGFAVESLPQDVELTAPWGAFTSHAEVSSDGRTVDVTQALKFSPCVEPASSYSQYRDFARAISRAYVANMVLVKTD